MGRILPSSVNSIKRYFYIFRSLFISQYALMIEYRAEIVLWALSGILPLIMLTIWKEADISKEFGFNHKWLSSYFISAFIVRQFTAVWVMVIFEKDNIEGKLSPYLLQPINPFWRYYISHIAEQFIRIPFVFIMLLLLFVLEPSFFWSPSLIRIILAIIAIFSAFTLRFLIHWFFSMLCFWTDRASSIERLLMIPYLFLSGLVAPLEAFPPVIRFVALSTPFPYILSFPSKILSGQDVNIINGYLVMFIWMLIFLLLGRVAWKFGLRKYSGMGA